MDTEIYKAIILGLIQGITEFLPISSTAHLILLPWFFGWTGDLNTLSFDIALHAGTLLALMVCFYRDWLDILMKKRGLLILLIIATIPAAVIGKLLDHYAEENLRSPLIIAGGLVLVGIFMYIAEKRFKTGRSINEVSLKDAIIIGISQAIAIIPGVSRSGITISTGLTRGINRQDSAKFSFLLSTPIIAGAVVLHGYSLVFKGHSDFNIMLFLSGILASFISGMFAIKFLMNFFKSHSMTVFVYYRIILALIIVGLWVNR